MARIKISSNPYIQQASFFTWKDGWQSINTENSPNGNLVKKEYTKGFFPFKAYDIVQTVIREYQSAEEPIELVFEGSSDEFNELQDICALDIIKDNVTLFRSETTLANARDILPSIANIFQELRPIIDTTNCSNEVRTNIKKFFEVASDIVPICVMGNYSAGKSTFINALIGCELLPSGDQPVTAKIYQISQSHQQDYGSIRLTINGLDVALHFNESGLIQENDYSNPLYDSILAATSHARQNGLVAHMNATLEAINDMATSEQFAMADLVAVEAPFCRTDSWSQSGRFVIFDTPGSNSASSTDHLRVLREAMKAFPTACRYTSQNTAHSTARTTPNSMMKYAISKLWTNASQWSSSIRLTPRTSPKKGFPKTTSTKSLAARRQEPLFLRHILHELYHRAWS